MRPRSELPLPGKGSIAVDVVASASTVVSAAAMAPLKLLVPRPRGASAMVCIASFGGGLLAGDAVDLDIRVGKGASALCTTQAATKVYKSENGVPARQSLSAFVDDGALLALLPDPICAFAKARYEQRQKIELARGASLVLVDLLVSGRVARGERYQFTSFRTNTDIFIDGHLAAVDAMMLEDTPESSVADRMGRFDAIATAFVIGPRVEASAAGLVASFAKDPVNTANRPRAVLLATASPIPGGAIIRVTAEDPEEATAFLRRALAFLPDQLGADPWARKW